jgi:BirA family transcriptional regulator, biotin operon repressor / biotin---[acetyl-CoA-carboxylase] ligase
MIIGSNLLFYDSLTSTNTEAVSLLKTAEPDEGTVICAGFQSAGRGQSGNRWESEKGKNLLFSVILYPRSVNAEEQFLVSMTISLGICDFLDRHIKGVRIKWPNDILTGNDKIAGILIETSILGSEIESLVAGIGLNLNQDAFPDFHPRPVSLKMATDKEYDILTCLKELLPDLDRRYKHLLYGDRESIKKDYIERLYRFLEWSRFSTAGRTFTGRITDVSVSGQVSIEEQGSGIRKFSFKEFSYLA